MTHKHIRIECRDCHKDLEDVTSQWDRLNNVVAMFGEKYVKKD